MSPRALHGSGEFVYEYHYKDHLGNLRVAFRENNGASSVDYTATMETSPIEVQRYEEQEFMNVNKCRDTQQKRNGAASARVFWDNNTSRPLGPWKSIPVSKGDQLAIEVFARYTSTNVQNPIGDFSAFLSANPGYANTTSVDGQAITPPFSLANLSLGLTYSPPANNPNSGAPRAYLRYMFYNSNKELISSQLVYVNTTALALANQNNWQKLEIPNFTLDLSGYVEIYVANESNISVWFDDFKITHTPSLIAQENHYDPWGLNLVGIEKPGTPDNKFQFQGQEKVEDFGLNWFQFKWRMSDPQLGRFHCVDSLADKYVHNSVYAFSENKVTNHVELEGLEAVPAQIKQFGNYIENKVKSFQDYVSSTVNYFTSNTKVTGSLTAKVTQGSYGGDLKVVGAKFGAKTTAGPEGKEVNLIGWHENVFELAGKNSEGVGTTRHYISGANFFGGKVEVEVKGQKDELKSLKVGSEVNFGLFILGFEKDLKSGETNVKAEVSLGTTLAAYFGIAVEGKAGLEFTIQKGNK